MTSYRRGWLMELKEGAEAAYEEAHRAVWPEVLREMQEAGITRFVIHRHGTTLYAFQERDRPFPADAVPTETALRWWAKMAPLMVTEPDGRPRHHMIDEVFAFLPEPTAASE